MSAVDARSHELRASQAQLGAFEVIAQPRDRPLFASICLYGLRLALVLLPACVAVGTPPAGMANILVNGSFDDASPSPWVEVTDYPYPLIVSSADAPVVPHTIPKLVWHGGIANADMSLYQDVAVPPGQGKLSLRGQMQIVTSESGPVAYDFLYVEIRDVNGALIEVLAMRNNSEATTSWTPFQFAATGDYAGQTIRLQLRSTNDISLETSFFLDTFVLEATATVDAPGGAPRVTRLSMAAPNPTAGTTRMRLELPAPARGRAWISDLPGRVVRTLVDGPLPEGTHDLTWDGTDAAGGRTAPGVYFLRVEVDGQVFSRKIVRIR